MHRLLWLATALSAGPLAAETALPFDIGGAYSLTDQHGHARTEKDPSGQAQLLFFGYANCPGICGVALPAMAAMVEELSDKGIPVTPVMITVDPDRDKVETMGPPLAAIHADFVGLTGAPDALQVAYDAFAVSIEPQFYDPEHGWIYAHGSFVHLLDAEGKVLTLLPPILDVTHAVQIVAGYLKDHPSGTRVAGASGGQTHVQGGAPDSNGGNPPAHRQIRPQKK